MVIVSSPSHPPKQKPSSLIVVQNAAPSGSNHPKDKNYAFVINPNPNREESPSIKHPLPSPLCDYGSKMKKEESLGGVEGNILCKRICNRCKRVLDYKSSKIWFICTNPNHPHRKEGYIVCLDCGKEIPIDEERHKIRDSETARLEQFSTLHEPTLTREQKTTLDSLLKENYGYSSSFHAAKTYGKDIKKAKEHIDARLKEGEGIEVTGRCRNVLPYFISFTVEDPRAENLLGLVRRAQEMFAKLHSEFDESTTMVIEFILSVLPGLSANENHNLGIFNAWGFSRERTVYDLANGKKHLDIIFCLGEDPREKYVVDYGDDPFQSKHWCPYLAQAMSTPEEKDPSISTECEKCPIFRSSMDKDLVLFKEVKMH